MCLDCSGAAAVEALREELAQAKEQARASNAAALKVTEELRAEQAAHRRSEEKIAGCGVKKCRRPVCTP